MKKQLFLILVLQTLLGAQAGHAEPLPKSWEAQHWREIGPYTYNLPDPDVVELHLFEPTPEGVDAVDPATAKIADTKRFTGAEAKRIARLWRNQDWMGFGAACHEPAYGITFYRGDKKLFFGSICFNCMNVYIYTDHSDTAGFNREGRSYPQLRKLFKDIWGK